jgi:hypothetical protein
MLKNFLVWILALIAERKALCCKYTISTVVLRSIWLIRNDFIFNKQIWSNIKLILRLVES